MSNSFIFKKGTKNPTIFSKDSRKNSSYTKFSVPGGGGGGGGDWSTVNELFWYSRETGGDGRVDGVLMAYDFHDGKWWNTHDAPANNKGWTGYYESPTPAWSVVSSNGLGSAYAATHGTMAGQQGGGNIADHKLYHPSGGNNGHNEIWVRFFLHTTAGYQFSGEKVLAVNRAQDAGAGGIFFANVNFNTGISSPSSTGNLNCTIPVPMDENLGGYTLSSGRWYRVELHFKLQTSGNNGVYELFVDDWGDGDEPVNPGGSPTRRVNRTDVQYPTDANGIGCLWFENWANSGTGAGSTGRRDIKNIMVVSNVLGAHYGDY